MSSINNLRVPEVLRKLYWNDKLSIHKIAKNFKVTPNAVRYYMIKNNIQRRKAKNVQKENCGISEEVLKELYLKKKLTLDKICKALNVKSRSTIIYKLIKYNIPLRTMSEARTKYLRKPFCGDPKEKAYMFGLRAGDITVRRDFHRILVSCSTTHPAQIGMIRKTFGKYSHIGTYIHKDKRNINEWHVYCGLHKSFDFLVEKANTIPNWILENNEYFFAFLAGYIDCEGSFDIWKSGKNSIAFSFRVATNDKTILDQTKNKLSDKGFNPRLYLFARRGDNATYGTYTKDVYALKLLRKNEIVRLVEILLSSSRHNEKISRMMLMLEIKDAKKWSEVEDSVLKLRKRIKEKRLK